MTGNHGVQEWEYSFHLSLNGELDNGFNHVNYSILPCNSTFS